MPNKLLRTVSRPDTARRFVSTQKKTVSVFSVTTYGYFESGPKAGMVNKLIIRERKYEIYDGEFYAYQKRLRDNQEASRVPISTLNTFKE